MAGPLATATDDAARQILAIGAQQGDQGVAAFNDALGQVQADRQAALARTQQNISAINAPPTALGELNAIQGNSLGRTADQIAQARAQFQGDTNRNAYAGLVYQKNLGAVEPMLDAYIAAKAAADAASSSGGGGGGGGSGKGDTLTNTELKTQLTGAATQARQQDVTDAAARLRAAAQARQGARAVVNTQNKRLQVVARGMPQKRVNRIVRTFNNAPKGSQKRKDAKRQLLALRSEILSRPVRASRVAAQLGQARTGAQQAAVAQRKAYGDVLAAGSQPLGDYARAIGTEAGVDPNQVYGVITPTVDKSFNLADADALKRAGGVLGQYGRAPTLGPRAAAREVGLQPAKVQQMRKSKNYTQLASSVEDALAKGVPFAQVQRGLQASWGQAAGDVPVYNKKKIKQRGVTYAPGTLVVGHAKGRPHANLVKLVLSDYAPSFQR